MPRPAIPRSYDPETLGAKCSECPLDCKGRLPVPPNYAHARQAKAVLVLEGPGGVEKYQGANLTGNAGERFRGDLQEHGEDVASFHVVNRIACFVPGHRRTEKTLRAAAKACLPRVQAELEHLPTRLPRLYLGKWAPVGLVPAREHKAQLEIKLSQGVVRNNAMCLPHPKYAHFQKPAYREVFQTLVGRFLEYANGKPWPRWPDVIFQPGQAMLEALRGMGPLIAFDIETLGIDPLTSPISAIGVSDGARVVSVPWVSYSNRHGYHVGIAESKDPKHAAIRTELKRLLESRREKAAHNGAFDIPGLRSIGISTNVDWDTIDAYKICHPELPGNLEAVSVHLFPVPSRWKMEFKAGRDDDGKGGSEFEEAAHEDLLTYNGRDSYSTALDAIELKQKLAKED